MRVEPQVLPVLLLVGLCPSSSSLGDDGSSTSQGAGEVPLSQLRMLSLGLARLLRSLEENTGQLERQGERAAAELDGATKSLENLLKLRLQAGRSHRQVRKDLQILSARGDRLWRTVKELQSGLDGVETEQRSLRRRTDQLLQTLETMTREPRSRGQLDFSAMKSIVDKQARRLATLTSQVSAQDKLMARRQLRIEHLEKHVREPRVSDSVTAAAVRPHPDSDCVWLSQLHQHGTRSLPYESGSKNQTIKSSVHV